MKTSMLRFQILAFSALLLAANASAGTLTGVIRNGTNGSLVPNQDVVLIQLQAGMETVASTKSDPQGRYSLDHPAIGQGPVLVRVPYRGVNFHQNVPPGRSVADVEVFEPTTDPGSVEVLSRAIIFQPNGAVLLVGEEYSIHNHSKPPKAFFKTDGNFEFEIPEGAEVGQVAAWGPSGMPVGQGTIDKGKNRYAVAYAFRPGENGVRLAYQIPYSTNSAVVRAAALYPARRVSLIVPPTMQVQAEGFKLSGTDQGWNVFTREPVPAGGKLEIAVSGTAPPINADATQQQSGSTGAGAPTASLSQMPGRLDSLKWPLIAGFSALFALGLIFLWRRPMVIVPAVAGNGAAPVKAPARAQAQSPDVVAEVDRQVGQSMDEIKETLFRLELRRQAGTISEADYTRERTRAEKYLRDMLQG
jgi:hypothetical protein